MNLSLGYSPCPNDTFIFHAIAKGLLQLPDCRLSPQLHDVETLNRMALQDTLDISKLSFYAWLKLKDTYTLLQSGASVGFGCGPVVISRRRIKYSDLSTCRVVLPGEWTTAHLLFQLWAPGWGQRSFVPYNQIFNMLEADQADCGVIIHENRFTFEQAGFRVVMDLGAWWEAETGLPLPLGCIAVKKKIAQDTIRSLEDLIRQSIRMAQQRPEDCLPYIRRYAQEMDDKVIQKHIRTFVNEFSLGLGETGGIANKKLEEMAQTAGVIT